MDIKSIEKLIEKHTIPLLNRIQALESEVSLLKGQRNTTTSSIPDVDDLFAQVEAEAAAEQLKQASQIQVNKKADIDVMLEKRKEEADIMAKKRKEEADAFARKRKEEEEYKRIQMEAKKKADEAKRKEEEDRRKAEAEAVARKKAEEEAKEAAAKKKKEEDEKLEEQLRIEKARRAIEKVNELCMSPKENKTRRGLFGDDDIMKSARGGGSVFDDENDSSSVFSIKRNKSKTTTTSSNGSSSSGRSNSKERTSLFGVVEKISDPFQTKSKSNNNNNSNKVQKSSLFGDDNADSIATTMKLKSSKKENDFFPTKTASISVEANGDGNDDSVTTSISSTTVIANETVTDASTVSNQGTGIDSENVDEMVEVSL